MTPGRSGRYPKRGALFVVVTLLQRLSSSNVWLCYVVVQGTAAKLSLNMLWMSLDVLTAEALTLG